MNRTLCRLITVFLVIVPAPSVLADEREPLKTLVEKVVKVAGVEKIKMVRAWTLSAKVTDRSDGNRSGIRRVSVQYPDQYRSDFECEVYPGDAPIKTSVVVNARKGWRTVIGETEELSSEDVDREKARMQLQPGWSRDVALLLDEGYQLTPAAEKTITGRVAVGIKLVREGSLPIHLYFDKETCRLLKTERSRKDGQRSETIYADYREVEGVQVPHRWTFKTDGNVDYESEVEGIGKVRFKAAVQPEDWVYDVIELKFVDKLDRKLFEKP